MATIFTRGFLLRTLPALLALVLGLLVAPQQPAHSAAAPQATAYTTVAAPVAVPSRPAVHPGQSAESPAGSETPSTSDRGRVEHSVRLLRTQITVSTDGSRAPPFPLV